MGFRIHSLLTFTVLVLGGCVPVVVDEPVGKELEQSQVEKFLGVWVMDGDEGRLAYTDQGKLVFEAVEKGGNETYRVHVTEVRDAVVVWGYSDEFAGYVFGRVAFGGDEIAVLGPEVTWIREAMEAGLLTGEVRDGKIRLESEGLEGLLEGKAFWHLNHALILTRRTRAAEPSAGSAVGDEALEAEDHW